MATSTTDSLPKEDQLGLSTLNRQELEDSLRAWIKSNSPGGWIDDLRCDVARYESSRQVLTLLIDTQRDKIRELEAERDQYKQIAEINANTIKCMQAAVNLHANRIDEIYGVKS